MPIIGQQGSWLWASDMDDPHSHSVTVQVNNRDTFAEIALYDVWVTKKTFHSSTATIKQIVSASGVENFSNVRPLAFRKNVTSITFTAYTINALTGGRWMLHFWA